MTSYLLSCLPIIALLSQTGSFSCVPYLPEKPYQLAARHPSSLTSPRLTSHNRSRDVISATFNMSLTSVLSSPSPGPRPSLRVSPSVAYITTAYLKWPPHLQAPSQHLPPEVFFQNIDLIMLLSYSKIFHGCPSPSEPFLIQPCPPLCLLSACSEHTLFFSKSTLVLP